MTKSKKITKIDQEKLEDLIDEVENYLHECDSARGSLDDSISDTQTAIDRLRSFCEELEE